MTKLVAARAGKRTITPEILRAALAQVHVVPPAPRSLASVILDAIEVGYARLVLATVKPVRSDGGGGVPA